MNSLMLKTLVCGCAILLFSACDVSAQGSHGSTAHTSGGSHGSYGGWTPIRNGIARRQARRSNRQHRRAARQAARGSHGGTAHGSSHGSTSYGSAGSTSYGSAGSTSYGSAGSTSYAPAPAQATDCPECAKQRSESDIQTLPQMDESSDAAELKKKFTLLTKDETSAT